MLTNLLNLFRELSWTSPLAVIDEINISLGDI